MCEMSVLEGLWGKNTDKEGVAGGRVNAQAFSLSNNIAQICKFQLSLSVSFTFLSKLGGTTGHIYTTIGKQTGRAKSVHSSGGVHKGGVPKERGATVLHIPYCNISAEMLCVKNLTKLN